MLLLTCWQTQRLLQICPCLQCLMLLPALMITCTHAKIHFEQEKALNSESTQRRADEEHEQDLNVSQIPRHRGSVQGLAGSGKKLSLQTLDVQTSRDTKCRGPPRNPSRLKRVNPQSWNRERRIANTPHPCPRMTHHACWMCIHRR